MFQFVSKSVALVDYLDHNDGIGDEELLDQACCFDFRVRHQKHYHDLYLIHEWEKVKQFGNVV